MLASYEELGVEQAVCDSSVHQDDASGTEGVQRNKCVMSRLSVLDLLLLVMLLIKSLVVVVVVVRWMPSGFHDQMPYAMTL